MEDHWNDNYAAKPADQMGWFEEVPTTSLELIRSVEGETLIDVGGGTSTLVDNLLNDKMMTVMDISENSINITKKRLGDKADKVKWIVGDITKLKDVGTYDIWHDRAVFHFFTTNNDQSKYKQLATRSIKSGGHLIIGTFSLEGASKCSGLPVCRYDKDSLSKFFEPEFKQVRTKTYTHTTPSGSVRPFVFALLRKI